jgi:fructokinase
MSENLVAKNRTLIFGEVLVDLFLDTPAKPREGSRLFSCQGVPGGAPCNVAAHLAYLGLPVSFISGFADDPIGAELRQMLIERQIDLTYSKVHPQSSSPLAMVFIKPDGDRAFRLYLTGSALECMTPSTIDPTAFDEISWFHFGSVLLAFPNPKDMTLHLLQEARKRNILISYDINIRPDIWQSSPVDRQVLHDVLRYVDVIKFSDEDFAWLQTQALPDLRTPQEFFRYGCQMLACTHGKDGATLITPAASVRISAPSVKVVDTTGAGDAFMAGLIGYFQKEGIKDRINLRNYANSSTLEAAGKFAATCAGNILTQRGAMPT